MVSIWVPAVRPLTCMMYAAMSRYASSRSCPGRSGGIEAVIVFSRSRVDRVLHPPMNPGPASGGTPRRSGPWQPAQF
jgi:hypothetical protein